MTQSNHTTTITYQQLSAEERGQIEAFLKDHQSVRQIARNLHRNPSTISREIK
ncbi:helix-turn-helix domain-containing protein, partial [Levilactobacillus parabrevis]